MHIPISRGFIAKKPDSYNALADLLPTQIEPATDFASEEQMGHLTSWREAATAMANAESAIEDIRSSAAQLKQDLEKR